MPLPEGIGQVVERPKDVFEGSLKELRISQAATLKELEPDFAFFTTALLHTHAGLRRDLVQEFLNEHRGSPVIAIKKFDKPIFRGLSAWGSGSWAHTLLVIERSAWESCFKFLAVVALQDTAKGILYRCLPHDVPIADQLFLDKQSSLPSDVPMVNVTVFGLDGNKKKVYIQKAMRPPIDLPMVMVDKPDPATVIYARKLFRGENPLT